MTDFLDGISARLLGATSSLGAELDSIADSVGGVAVTFYLYVLFPPVFGEILPYLIITGFLGTIYICLALYKIGRIGLHFWSAKLMGVTTFVFQVHTSLVGFNRVVFYVWIATFTLAMTEQILALLLGTPTYRTKSIFEVLP